MTRAQNQGGVIPDIHGLPRHVAIIMDGNGRWAIQRFRPRGVGHRRGVESVRAVIKECMARGIGYLTLFAFSSENWRRAPEEVSFLMRLFKRALEKEVARMHAKQIRLRVIGDLSRFDPKLVAMIRDSERLTEGNQRLILTIAANYGGRWDILQAIGRMLSVHPERRDGFDENDLAPHLAMAYAPEPDLMIRTGGEQRISNFLLWQLTYTELYFTERLWPDFGADALAEALASYRARERRFGRTSEQTRSGPRNTRIAPDIPQTLALEGKSRRLVLP